MRICTYLLAASLVVTQTQSRDPAANHIYDIQGSPTDIEHLSNFIDGETSSHLITQEQNRAVIGAPESIVQRLQQTYTSIKVTNRNLESQKNDIGDEHDMANELFFKRYQTWENAKKALERFAEAHPQLLQLGGSIGKSVEGRDLLLLRLSASAERDTKPRIYIQCGIHAREWVSPAACLFAISELVTRYEGADDPGVRTILEESELLFLTHANPDGYVFTMIEEGDRLWRKNRGVVNGEPTGVDLNRNFPFGWASLGEKASSSSPHSRTYHGEVAASEPETRAIMDHVQKEKPICTLDVHAYGQLVLYPPGRPNDTVGHLEQLSNVGERMSTSMTSSLNHTYNSMIAKDWYPADGVSQDFFYSLTMEDEETGMSYHPYAFTIELVPGSESDATGFFLPPSEIEPAGRDLVRGIMAMSEGVLQETLFLDASYSGSEGSPWLKAQAAILLAFLMVF